MDSDALLQFALHVAIRCTRFLGNGKTHILDQLDLQGTISNAVDKVPEFIRRNTRLAAEFGAMQRKDIPEYPPLAIREALINALVHADYSLQEPLIQINIFNDRLEIRNPGTLGVALADLKAGVSQICSGYKRIVDACQVGGYPKPKWNALKRTVRVTFYPHPATVLPEDRVP